MGYNFTVALFYPGLQGDAKSRNAAKNVFSRWRAKVLQFKMLAIHILCPCCTHTVWYRYHIVFRDVYQVQLKLGKAAAVGIATGGVKTLDDILREAAGDAGMSGLTFGGDLTLSDLMAQLTSATESSGT